MAFILIYIGFYSNASTAVTRTCLLLLLLLLLFPVRVCRYYFLRTVTPRRYSCEIVVVAASGNPVDACGRLLLLLLLNPVTLDYSCTMPRYRSPIMFGNPRRAVRVLLFEHVCYCSNACVAAAAATTTTDTTIASHRGIELIPSFRSIIIAW